MLGVDEGNRRISLGLKQTEAESVGSARREASDRQQDQGQGQIDHRLRRVRRDRAGHRRPGAYLDLSWTKKVRHPSEVYKKGDEVEAVVLGIEVENERVSLGVKQLTPDPWDTVAQRYPLNTRVNGKVSSVADFGVFVEIEEGHRGADSHLAVEQRAGRQAVVAVQGRRRARSAGGAGRQQGTAHRAFDQGACSSTRSARRCRPISSASTRRRASRWKIS